MTRTICPRHGRAHPCTCAMGNIYRFIEPVLLLILKEKGHSYGYELSENLASYALTDAQIERAALYRTLRTLEEHGYVTSNWETESAGPARRVYSLTKAGHVHLREWAEVMARLGDAMKAFSKKAAGSAIKQ
jgi:PadR family transcriptional regulator, regulatory protein PadR